MKALKISAVALAGALALSAAQTARATGIPVLDVANLTQAVQELFEQINQGINQLKALQTQYDQYEDQLRNTLAPAAYVWDKATYYTSRAQDVLSTIDYYKNNGGGSLDRYLSTFGDASRYRGSPCFSVSGCSSAEMSSMLDNQVKGADATKAALDNQVRYLDLQMSQIKSDSSTLEQLQANAEGAEGRMQAAQAGNQLLSNQANQLLSIRSLLVSQQQAESARAQQVADKDAQQQAAAARLRSGTYQASAPMSWSY